MTSLLDSLVERELGNKPWRLPFLSKTLHRKVDDEYKGTVVCLDKLQKAITSGRWDDVEAAVGDTIYNLLDNSSESQLFAVTPLKKQQRERFVLGGGIAMLMQLFQPPFLRHTDGRNIPASDVRHKSEVWNEILVILREVAFAIPTLSDRVFSTEQMVFLFTMLHHQPIFDNTMNLLEEILASREDTFQLSLVPGFYALIGKFSARQLAHFCRVLSLVLFEPEDRHVMEGTHVLHSTELLQLRRNRMARNCGASVERNQSLMIEMPGVLARLVHILRIVNFGPNLSELISHNIVPQMPITSDILTFFSSAMGISDWDHFNSLEQIVQEGRGGEDGTTDAWSSPRSPGTQQSDMSTLEDEDITAELLNSFSPTIGADGMAAQTMDVSNIVNVMQVARNLGIADMTPLGEALLGSQPMQAANVPPPPTTPPAPSLYNALRSTLGGGGGNGRGGRNPRMTVVAPGRAKKELQFHAMMLSPHQIELIFVLCTLLSGRRKIAVQAHLAAAGLDGVLHRMFDRMSWGFNPPPPPGGPQHIHGPNCECDSAESPLRVQFLRLIHNFYDRDFLGNSNKVLMLSAAERQYVLGERLDVRLDTSNTAECGLLGKTIQTLLKEPPTSVYKFWLSACVENFLRGCGRMGQAVVAQSGALEHTARQIVALHGDTNASLQTSFDLLGEVVKCNHTVLAQLDGVLNEEEFVRFKEVVMTNLIDSNVFVRSLYLTMEMVSYSYSAFERDAIAFPLPTSGLSQFGFHMNCLGVDAPGAGANVGRVGYLRDSWVQFEPTVLSTRALQTPTSVTKGSDKGKSRLTSSSRSSLSKAPSTPSRRGLDHSDEAHSPTTLSAIGSGVLGALKDIRSATKSFLRLGDNASASTPATSASASGKVVPWSGEDEGGRKLSIECGEGEFFDCTTGPPNGESVLGPDSSATLSSWSPSKHSQITSSSATATAQCIQDLLLSGSPAKSPARSSRLFVDAAEGKEEEDQAEAGITQAVVILSTRLAPPAPDNLSRIAAFLQAERTHVLVRLMSTVSLTTINHENICCLNTALLILLLEHKRARLGAVLAEVKERATLELSKARALKAAGEDESSSDLGGLLLNLSIDNGGCCANCRLQKGIPALPSTSADASESTDAYCGTCAVLPSNSTAQVPALPTTTVTSTATATASIVSDEERSTPPAPVDEEGPSGAAVVCRNFRELLWYWQEYYLRRGRDRLSVEFSAHIPFRYWQSIVGLMCRDNGDSTSLLAGPITLPPSPYSRPTPGHPAALPSDQNCVCNI